MKKKITSAVRALMRDWGSFNVMNIARKIHNREDATSRTTLEVALEAGMMILIEKWGSDNVINVVQKLYGEGACEEEEVIIQDTKEIVGEATDTFIFAVEQREGHNLFWIVSTSYWERSHCFDENECGDELFEVDDLYDHFNPSTEGSCFHFRGASEGGIERGTQILLDAGLSKSEELQSFVDENKITAADFIFATCDNPDPIDEDDEVAFLVSRKTYWERNGYQDDRECGVWWNARQEGFDEVCEGCFSYEKGSFEEGKQKLLELGMTQPNDFQEFADSCG